METENVNERSNDYFATEILGELKEENLRKSRTIRSLIKGIIATVAIAVVAIGGTIAGFLWYLNQYDFSGTSSTYNDADGVYALIDSEGNVISADLTKEELEMIMNGNSAGSESNYQTQD